MSFLEDEKPTWDLFDEYSETNEYELFDSIIKEKNDIVGFPILYYIKQNKENADFLYGEDPNETFSDGYRTKILYEPSEEPQILNVFGMTSDDTIQYAQIAKSIFTRDIVTEFITDNPSASTFIPRVGDVIQTLWNNKHYEIAEVGAEQQIFQAKKFIWEFILKPYRHSDESNSAEDMLFYDPSDDDFPDLNVDTTTQELSGFGDNDDISDEAEDIITDVDSSVYGY